ncbi:unnamed protein product [Moneuplotes crassus]|uniref:Uncharacterized protein n=1 Tax=Euplotes crassus TaxID=5936 RepID=A0AAD1U994_EUPCR|nr:unnamed protein product [Moneuplotes crassus]
MEESYLGNPSEKFLEEKLKLNRVIDNIHKIEDAIPIIHKMYLEQQKQSAEILKHKVQMQDYLSRSSIETQFNGFKVEIEGSILQRLKLFQNQVSELIHTKVDKQEYIVHTKALPNIINDMRSSFDKKIATLENEKMTSLRRMLVAKIQEIDLLVNTKANDAELQVVKNNKADEEDIKAIQEELKQIKSVVSTIEGEDHEYNNDQDTTPNHQKETPSAISVEENSSLRSLFQDYLEKIQQDSTKKHLKYQQVLLIEAIKKILYDDNRFENMRKEILIQREEIELIRKDNDELTYKVKNCVTTVDKANELIDQISSFKEQLDADHKESCHIISNCQKQYQELASKHSNLQAKTTETRKDAIKRLVNLETTTKENQHQISLLQMQKTKFDKIAENEISIKNIEHNLEKAMKEFDKKIKDFRDEYHTQTQAFTQDIDSLSDPVRQALEKNQRESENILNELKHIQKQSRDVFCEFDKSKANLIEVIDNLRIEHISKNCLKNTISKINLDTKILMHDQVQAKSSTGFKGVVDKFSEYKKLSQMNIPMSPVTYARATTAQSSQSKINPSHFPILKSKNGYITSRDISRNDAFPLSEGGFKSFDGNTIKEEEERKEYYKINKNKAGKKKDLILKSRLNQKPNRYNEELRRSKSAIKGQTSSRKLHLV